MTGAQNLSSGAGRFYNRDCAPSTSPPNSSCNRSNFDVTARQRRSDFSAPQKQMVEIGPRRLHEAKVIIFRTHRHADARKKRSISSTSCAT